VNGDFWLQPYTKEKMLKIVVHELITNTAETICDKEGGIFTFFQEKQLEKLQLLFEVFKYD
jgi:hypothetical protein